jgi:hypothetical protein
MKIFITESQFKRIVEAVDLNNSFKNLKVNDVLVLSVDNSKDSFDYKFRVVEDMDDTWKLANLNRGSVNVGFDWYVEKNEAINDSKVILVKVSKKDKTGKREKATLKNVKSAKVGDYALSLANAGDNVDPKDIEKSYDLALSKIKEAEPNIDADSAHEKAFVIVNKEFGDDPEVEIIYNKKKKEVNPDFFNTNAEDIDYMDVSDLDALVKQFKAGEGVRFTLRDDDSLSVINFNVLSISGNTANIKLIETDSSEYNKYRKARFVMNFDGSYITVNDNKTSDIKLPIADTGGDITIKNVVKINATPENDDEVKVDKEMLLKYIQSDPVLMNAFAKTPTLMGLINVGDVRGLSKAYELLSKAGFDFDGSQSEDIKSGNFSDKFSSNYSSKIRLLTDVNFFEGEKIVAGDKVVRVKRSKNTVILTDTDGNTYKILKDLNGDIYEVNAQRKQDKSGIKVKIKVLDYKTQN